MFKEEAVTCLRDTPGKSSWYPAPHRSPEGVTHPRPMQGKWAGPGPCTPTLPSARSWPVSCLCPTRPSHADVAHRWCTRPDPPVSFLTRDCRQPCSPVTAASVTSHLSPGGMPLLTGIARGARHRGPGVAFTTEKQRQSASLWSGHTLCVKDLSSLVERHSEPLPALRHPPDRPPACPGALSSQAPADDATQSAARF